jgi:hypothetical protein
MKKDSKKALTKRKPVVLILKDSQLSDVAGAGRCPPESEANVQ